MNRRLLAIIFGSAAAAGAGYGVSRYLQSRAASGTEKKQEDSSTEPEDSPLGQSQCPECGKPVKEYEFFCPYCGYTPGEEPGGKEAREI